MKYNFMDEELKMRFPFNGNFESIANKINYSVKNVKSPNNIYVKRIMVGICSIFVLLITGTVVLPGIINNGFIVQFWDDKTIVQKYPSFTYSNIKYTIFSTYIKEGISSKYIGNKVDDIAVCGIDDYNKDKEYFINAEIYEIKNVYKECAYAIKFEGDKEYYSYLNTNYEFETLGDFIEKLNLEEYLQFGTATYKNNIVYKDFDDSIVWDMLLSDYSLTNTSLTNNNYKNPLMSISTNIEALGIENVSFAVNDEGYIQTNILGTAKTFYIGEEKVNNFIDYIIKNIPKKNLF